MSQTVTAPETATYVLTAYCATNILPGNVDGNVILPGQHNRVTLGVSVNGSTVAAQQARVATYLGYQKYSIVFKASARSSIKVWFYAPKVHPVKNLFTYEKSQPPRYAIIDAVSLVKRMIR
ncbi:MAG: hypothetical protein M3X11_19045 [Acidobacteriota bacterium]|nr:hypothetical protein [Acidobacteriota bacterium]